MRAMQASTHFLRRGPIDIGTDLCRVWENGGGVSPTRAVLLKQSSHTLTHKEQSLPVSHMHAERDRRRRGQETSHLFFWSCGGNVRAQARFEINLLFEAAVPPAELST